MERNNQSLVSSIQLLREKPKGKLGILKRFRRTVRIILVTALTSGLIATSLIAFGVDNLPTGDPDGIDDALVVSAAAPGTQSFPETGAGPTDTITEIDFNVEATNNTMFSGGPISGRRLYGALANQQVVLGTSSGSFANFTANVWGGAGGAGIYPGINGGEWTITFNEVQRYIGFWWSAGNPENYVQLLGPNGENLLDPEFSTAGVVTTVLDGNSCLSLGDYSYDGSYPPETLTGNSWERYCGNPNQRFHEPPDEYFAPEPYAFVQLRFEGGFRGVKFYGTGFEFDNLTFSETIPAGSVGDVAVGGGLNTTCAGVGALQNGGFENFGFENTPGDTQFSSGSSSWRTTATDGKIEIWRGLPVNQTDSAISGPGDASARGGTVNGGVTRGNIAELQANDGGGSNQGLYQDISTVGGSTIRYSFWHHARSGGGSDQNQQVTVRIGAVPSPDPADTDNGWNSSEQSSASSSFGTQGPVSSRSLTDEWTRTTGSYTVPEGQSATRFLFVSLVNGGSNSYGNLLDDIEFTPTLACPDETSIIVNRSAVTFSPFANDFRPNSGNTLTIVSTTVGGTATVSGTDLQLSSTTAGSFTVRYRLTNEFGDTSDANVDVTVLSDSASRAANVVLVDPRVRQVTIPEFGFSNATNLLVCLDEWNGSAISAGSPALKFDVSTKGTVQSTGEGSAIVSGDRTGALRVSHALNNVISTLNSSNGVTAFLDTGAFSSTRYIRVRSVPIASSTTIGDCSNASNSSSSTIEIRPLEISQTVRRVVVPLKN